ncbi:hypothetical protein, partial [Enterococcus faecium]|uniref:hypothetical protein n=1 Tax=Enterococcus faecium TaxID=1352 RepID=UPI003908240F
MIATAIGLVCSSFAGLSAMKSSVGTTSGAVVSTQKQSGNSSDGGVGVGAAGNTGQIASTAPLQGAV